jgi:hypothetical protein
MVGTGAALTVEIVVNTNIVFLRAISLKKMEEKWRLSNK